MKTEKISVIGAGVMGIGIAALAANKDCVVNLVDIDEAALARAKSTIKYSECITINKDMTSVKGSSIAIEAVTENMEIKKQIIAELNRNLDSEAIIATNTSSLSVTELASASSRQDRFVGMHFFNPPTVIKLIEIIRTPNTSQQTLNFINELAGHMGKTVIEINDSPGFIVNRMLIPMINEAIIMLDNGVADARTIDKAMKLGAMHTAGPLRTADAIGLDVCMTILESLKRDLNDSKYEPCSLLRKMVSEGKLGQKTALGFYKYREDK